MRRPLHLWLFLTGLLGITAATALADPGIRVYYHDELLRVTLEGSYAGSYYQVFRSGELIGQFDPLSSQLTLCTGDCFLTDLEVTPGRTYYYRFDIYPPNGGTLVYGPYAVTVPDTPIGVRAWPNPSFGATRIELSLPGSTRRDTPVPAEARLLDAGGRSVRLLYSGNLRRGNTSVSWDGRGDAGQQLGAGVYFLRLTSPLGNSTARIIRFR